VDLRLSIGLIAWAMLGIQAPATAGYALSPFQNYPTTGGCWQENASIGDINGDGRNDIVATAGDCDGGSGVRVLVFLQTASGALATPRTIAVADSVAPTGLTLADLDHDGRDEIIFGHRAGLTLVHWDPSHPRLPASSRFYATAVPDAALDVTVVDVNRDGALDVVGLSPSQGLTIFLGDGHGAVTGQVAVGANATGYNDMKAGDFNGDGYKDIALVAGQGYLPAYVFYNDGSDDFSSPVAVDPSPGTDANSGVLASGDFNGDGRTDLVAIRDSYSLALMLQNTSGALDAPSTLPYSHPPFAMVGDDLDLDGRDDLVASEGGSLNLYFQSAQGVLTPTVADAPGSMFSTEGLAVGDVNGDDCPDVVTNNYAYGIVVSKGYGCNPIPDLAPSLALTSTTLALRLNNIGAADALAPETTVTVHTASGVLSIGSVGTGCALGAQSAQSSTIVCNEATAPAGSSSSRTWSIQVAGAGLRNVVDASAVTTTTSIELKLHNNVAHATLFAPRQ
jgi:hypothetical protein